MLLRKIFENLHAVMAILVLFGITFTQILFKLFDPNSVCLTKYDAFCSNIFVYACLRRKASLSKRFEIMKKLYTSKTFLKMASGRMHIPHPTS